MIAQVLRPTPYPDVNTMLNVLFAEVQAALADQFVGMYLYGSLASGDFDLHTSDVDFVVVTSDELVADAVSALSALHSRILGSGVKWAAKLEGSYISRSALRRYVPTDDTPWPALNEGQFYCAPHGFDWVIQRHVLREHGVVVVGPAPHAMIDPVEPAMLRNAVQHILRSWWAPMITQPGRLDSAEYQVYGILSMCRALHALHTGTIVSKPVAARWAQTTLGEPWAASIERAIAWRPGMAFNDPDAAIELIRHSVQFSEQWHSSSKTSDKD